VEKKKPAKPQTPQKKVQPSRTAEAKRSATPKKIEAPKTAAKKPEPAKQLKKPAPPKAAEKAKAKEPKPVLDMTAGLGFGVKEKADKKEILVAPRTSRSVKATPAAIPKAASPEASKTKAGRSTIAAKKPEKPASKPVATPSKDTVKKHNPFGFGMVEETSPVVLKDSTKKSETASKGKKPELKP
jgi:adenylate kinase